MSLTMGLPQRKSSGARERAWPSFPTRRTRRKGKEENVRFELNAFLGLEASVQPFGVDTAADTSDFAQVCRPVAEEVAVRQAAAVRPFLKGQPVDGMRTMKSDCSVVHSGAFTAIAS